MTFATRPTWKKAAIALAMTAALAACGGGGGSSSGGGNGGGGNGPAVGVFVDAPVNGLSYSAAPSGKAGVTGDAGGAGTFSYEPGDTVTFELGGLTLGSMTLEEEGGVVTPSVLSDDPNVVANLLVLLQSLDDPSDGVIDISLPQSVSLTGLTLTEDPEIFVATPAFTSAVDAAGGEVVSVEVAKEHATAQFWSQVAGAWHFKAEDEDSHVLLVVDAQGRYLIGETGQPDSDGSPSVEQGIINWDPLTRDAQVMWDIDDNGEWGMSHPPSGKWSIAYDGYMLKIHDTEEHDDGADFVRVPTSSGNRLLGTWAVVGDDFDAAADELPIVTQTFSFFADNTYLMLDPVGDEECGRLGIENAKYSYANGTLAVQQVLQDTNGCAGLNDTGGTGRGQLRNIRFAADGNSFTADVHVESGAKEGSVRMVRIGR